MTISLSLSDFELDLGDEWRNWRMDDPEWESDGELEESVTKWRKKPPIFLAPPVPVVFTPRYRVFLSGRAAVLTKKVPSDV